MLKIIIAVIFPYYKENTCDRQSICSQTVLKFKISVREKFSNFISLKVMRKYGKAASVQISAVF